VFHRVAICLLLIGCAGPSAPRRYADGPMVAPSRAPAFDPTFDSPNPFEGPEAPRIQPQPKPTRYLPQDENTRKEAGLWSAEVPRAAKMPPRRTRADPVPSVTVLDVLVDLGSDVRDGFDAMPTEQCAAAADIELRNPRRPASKEIWTVAPEHRKCVAALLVHRCLDAGREAFLGLIERKLSSGEAVTETDKQWKTALDNAMHHASLWVTETCPEEFAKSTTIGNIVSGVEQPVRARGVKTWKN
jgi:hypothetical protein